MPESPSSKGRNKIQVWSWWFLSCLLLDTELRLDALCHVTSTALFVTGGYVQLKAKGRPSEMISWCISASLQVPREGEGRAGEGSGGKGWGGEGREAQETPRQNTGFIVHFRKHLVLGNVNFLFGSFLELAQSFRSIMLRPSNVSWGQAFQRSLHKTTTPLCLYSSTLLSHLSSSPQHWPILVIFASCPCSPSLTWISQWMVLKTPSF